MELSETWIDISVCMIEFGYWWSLLSWVRLAAFVIVLLLLSIFAVAVDMMMIFKFEGESFYKRCLLLRRVLVLVYFFFVRNYTNAIDVGCG